MMEFVLITLILCVTGLIIFFALRRGSDQDKYVWFVSCHGFKTDGSRTQTLYGPFVQEQSACSFKNKWEDQFEGFAVTDKKLREDVK